jgi:protein kinase A
MELYKPIKKFKATTDFEIMNIIGVGTNAQVHFAKNLINKKYFAIKTIKKKEVIIHKQVDHIQNEIDILHMINHPFIVKLLI